MLLGEWVKMFQFLPCHASTHEPRPWQDATFDSSSGCGSSSSMNRGFVNSQHMRKGEKTPPPQTRGTVLPMRLHRFVGRRICTCVGCDHQKQQISVRDSPTDCQQRELQGWFLRLSADKAGAQELFSKTVSSGTIIETSESKLVAAALSSSIRTIQLLKIFSHFLNILVWTISMFENNTASIL